MRERLLAALRTALDGAGLWREDATLLAAVSGGADSVALLYALTLARSEIGFRLCACHVQHGLRGESALGDETFVRSLCQSLDVPLQVREAALGLTMDAPGVETAARERRRQLFSECMDAVRADALLTGHHLDDQAETVLLRLMRGAGAKGLSGIPPVAAFGRGVMLRPFLALGRRELQAALEEAGRSWRHDESNDLCCTPRNALRLDVLPRMEGLFPGAALHIAQAADSLGEDEACLETLAAALYKRAWVAFPSVFALEVRPLLQAPAALRVRALRRLYREGLLLAARAPEEKELSRTDSLALAALLTAPPGTVLNLPCGLSALRGRGCLHLTFQGGAPLRATAARPVPLCAAPGRYVFQRVAVEASPAAAPPPVLPGERQVCLPGEWLARCVLRAPRPGDTIRPLGASGSKPLRRFLTDRGIDAPFRAGLPLLAAKERVLWIPGLVTGEELRRRDGEGQWTLVVTKPKASFPYLLKE